jgi:integrase
MPLTIRKQAGSPFWFARGTVPARQPDGTIQNVRIERSTRCKSKRAAAQVAEDFARYYYELAHHPKPTPTKTFAGAALTYIQSHGGESDRFITKLIEHFGETPIDEIDQAAVAKAASELYPNGSASTHVRAVFAPTTTILRLSGVNPNFKRPRIQKAPVIVPPEDWFDAVLPHCPPKLAALLITLTLRGRRVTELLDLREDAIDYETGVAVIRRTKTGDPIQVTIPEAALELLKQERPKGFTGRYSRSVFGYVSRSNVYRALAQACERAGILVTDKNGKKIGGYYGSHAIGRHAFASRLLAGGKSVKFVAEAGRWKSPRLVLDTYGHLEHQDVDKAVDEVGYRWGSERTALKKTDKKQ